MPLQTDIPSGQDTQRPGAPRPRRAVLEHLRRQLERVRARHRPASRGLHPTGFGALDAILGGGLPGPAIHELVARTEAGGARTLALKLAWNIAGHAPASAILLIDPQGAFYPPAAAMMGIDLDRLLVGRVATSREALWLAEQALRCPALAAVVLWLRSIKPRSARRLQLAAEAGGNVGLLVVERACGSSFAASRLIVEPRPPKPDEADDLRLWLSQPLRVQVERLREGPAGREATIDLPWIQPAPICRAHRRDWSESQPARLGA